MLFSNSNMEFRQDQEEKVVRLKNIIAADPINWNEFLELDSELWVLSHEAAFDCSFSWILAHYPPPHVIKSLLERYQKFLFSNDVEIKSILNISLLESIPEVVQFIASRYSYIMNQPLDISGDVPLHRAQNGEIASIILQACPVSVGAQNHALELPLHAALLHQQHPDHIRLLVEQGVAMKVGGEEGCGGVLVQNSHGKSPFDMLNNQFETGIDLATLDNPIYETDRRMFNNLVTMVLAIRHVDRARASEFNVLHEIIRLDCPPSAIRMAQIMAPGQTGP
mmetsp:Transcript_19573/g.28889  ORF Transcript_19573/g.28889 Transcript_19573/m.28889 type:complete len:280 (+) Transcript_19573:178-1017(+)